MHVRLHAGKRVRAPGLEVELQRREHVAASSASSASAKCCACSCAPLAGLALPLAGKLSPPARLRALLRRARNILSLYVRNSTSAMEAL